MSRFLAALATFVGTVIGLGVFVLPYAFSQSGWFALLFFILVGAELLVLNLAYGEVIFQADALHNLPGYAALYLGRRWKKIVLFFDFVGLEGALFAYLIVSGEFTHLLFPQLSSLVGSALFFAIGLYPVVRDIKSVTRTELVFTALLIVLLVLISALAIPFVEPERITLSSAPHPFLAYGVILFALTGFSVLPEIREIVGRDQKMFARVNMVGSVLVWAVYVLFAFSIYGALGSRVTPDGVAGLANIFPPAVVRIAAVLGLVNVYTTFIALALYLKNGFRFDWGLQSTTALFLVFAPLIVLLAFGFREFVDLIGFIGAVLIAINALVILVVYRRIPQPRFIRLPAWVVWVLAASFALGMVSELIALARP